MSDSNFDPAAFLNMEVDAALETEFTPIPEGEYPAQIADIKPRTVNTKNGERVIVGVSWLITDPSVAEATGIDAPRVKQDIWIDQEDNGALSVGVNQNIQLGHLRDILGQNNPGEVWSFAQLTGGCATIKVKHRLTEQGRIMSEVADTAKAA